MMEFIFVNVFNFLPNKSKCDLIKYNIKMIKYCDTNIAYIQYLIKEKKEYIIKLLIYNNDRCIHHHWSKLKQKIFYLACECGDVKLAAWLETTQHVEIDKSEIAKVCNSIAIYNHFKLAEYNDLGNIANNPAKSGNIALIKLLRDDRIHYSDALKLAAGAGNMKIIKYLCSHFKYSRYGIEEAFVAAYSAGRIKIAAYLQKKFSIHDVETIREDTINIIKNGNLAIIKRFGITRNDLDNLELACKYGQLEIFKYLSKDLRLKDYYAHSMRFACIYGRKDIYDYLKTFNYYPVIEWEWGTPFYLFYGVKTEIHEELVEYLLKNNHVGYIDQIFQYACEHGMLAKAKMLVEKFHIDPHANMDRALEFACENGHFPIVKYLASLYNLKGLTILPTNIREPKIIEFLLNIGVWEYDYVFESLIEKACREDDPDIIKLMIKYGTKYNVIGIVKKEMAKHECLAIQDSLL